MRGMKTMSDTEAKNIILDLADKLNVSITSDICKSCENCYHYEKGDDKVMFEHKHNCFHPERVIIHPPEPDDMSHQEIEEGAKILDLSEATKCPFYESGKEVYKRLYEKSRKEMQNLKDEIRKILRK